MGFFLLLFSLPIFAQVDQECSNTLDSRISELETAWPNQNPQESGKFFISAALLYWWTDEVGLTYAMEGNADQTSAGQRTWLDTKVKPDTGFKIGLGTFLPHDQWDLFLQLTHLHSRVSISKMSTGGKVLFPAWNNPTNQPGGFVDKVHGHWRLHFALIDLELGRTLNLTDFFSLRPHLGMRYAIVRQKYLLHYEGGTLFPDGDSFIIMNNKCLFPGIRSGLDIKWNMKKGWGFYSNAACSLLYGNMYTHEDKKAPEGETSYHLIDRGYMGIAIFDLGFGLEWQKKFACDRQQVSFQFGWEEHLFLGQNNFFRFLKPGTFSDIYRSHESLDLQGITLRARWDL